MKATIYVDGSFGKSGNTHVYGSGIVILLPTLTRPLLHKCSGAETNVARLRNVAGELMAVITSLGIITQIPDCDEVEFYYDYEGIAKWVTGEWQTKNAFTKAYKQKMLEYMQTYKITFTKVTAHTGVHYNEEADRLAKEAVKEYVI